MYEMCGLETVLCKLYFFTDLKFCIVVPAAHSKVAPGRLSLSDLLPWQTWTCFTFSPKARWGGGHHINGSPLYAHLLNLPPVEHEGGPHLSKAHGKDGVGEDAP